MKDIGNGEAVNMAYPAIILDGAPNIRVGLAVPQIAAFSPLSSAEQPWAASVDSAYLISFTIRVGLRAAAALGIVTNN
jgi:hypothetical protein